MPGAAPVVVGRGGGGFVAAARRALCVLRTRPRVPRDRRRPGWRRPGALVRRARVPAVPWAGPALEPSSAGPIPFPSSAPAAVLPADYAFTPQDGGGHNFTVTLNSAGPQWFQITDATGLRDRVDSIVGGVTL